MSKFKSKYSPMKVVGIVFLVVTLLIAVSLTNNTVRQMISSSFAFDSVCAAKGDPKARNSCQVEVDKAKANIPIDVETASLKRKLGLYNLAGNLYSGLVRSNLITMGQYIELMAAARERLQLH